MTCYMGGSNRGVKGENCYGGKNGDPRKDNLMQGRSVVVRSRSGSFITTATGNSSCRGGKVAVGSGVTRTRLVVCEMCVNCACVCGWVGGCVAGERV